MRFAIRSTEAQSIAGFFLPRDLLTASYARAKPADVSHITRRNSNSLRLKSHIIGKVAEGLTLRRSLYRKPRVAGTSVWMPTRQPNKRPKDQVPPIIFQGRAHTVRA